MRPGRVVATAIAGVLGVAILVGLGLWQVQRLGEKQALITRIEARMAAAPVALPAEPDPARDRLLRVTARGRVGAPELDVLTSVRPWGAGFRVIAPFTLTDGRRVLVDLGYVPEDMKDRAARPSDLHGATIEVTGLLFWPHETDSFTPPPDHGRNIWFARDVPAMAAALGTRPVLIVAQAHGSGDWPRPDPPGASVPNDHLEYALTWFSLAVAWGVIAALLLRTEIRGRDPDR